MKTIELTGMIIFVIVISSLYFLISKENSRREQCKNFNGILVGSTCYKKDIVYELKD